MTPLHSLRRLVAGLLAAAIIAVMTILQLRQPAPTPEVASTAITEMIANYPLVTVAIGWHIVINVLCVVLLVEWLMVTTKLVWHWGWVARVGAALIGITQVIRIAGLITLPVRPIWTSEITFSLGVALLFAVWISRHLRAQGHPGWAFWMLESSSDTGSSSSQWLPGDRLNTPSLALVGLLLAAPFGQTIHAAAQHWGHTPSVLASAAEPLAPSAFLNATNPATPPTCQPSRTAVVALRETPQ